MLEWALDTRSSKRLRGKNKFRRLLRGRASKGARAACVVTAFMFILAVTSGLNWYFGDDPKYASHRRMMSGGQATCAKPIDMVGAPGAKGALSIPIYLLVIIWFFIGLASVTDDFFVPALVVISEKLDLSEDVAGATFMAAGSSAPELFTNLADVWTFGNSTGIGTIVGSAVFNILVIIACAGAFAKSSLNIDWRPFARDVGFYLTSIFLLFVFVQGWGTTPAPLHSFQYSKGDTVHAAFTAVGDYPGTEKREWYKDGVGTTFDQHKSMEIASNGREIKQGSVCCDEISDDGKYCKKLSGNGGRLRIDTEMPYFHGSGDKENIFKTGDECTAIFERENGLNPDAEANISAKLKAGGETKLYCCDPRALKIAYPYVLNAAKAETSGDVIGKNGYLKPQLDPVNKSPACNVPVTIWECACDSGAKNFPTAYVHGKPVCEGAILTEGAMSWWESLILFLSYGFYIAFMFKNKEILGKCRSKEERAEWKTAAQKRAEYKTELEMGSTEPNEMIGSSDQVSDNAPDEGNDEDKGKKVAEKGTPSEDMAVGAVDLDSVELSPGLGVATTVEQKEADEKDDKDDDEDEGPTTCWGKFVSCLSAMIWFLNWPWNLMFTWTIPDCNFEDEQEELQEELEKAGKNEAEIDRLINEAKAKKEKWYVASFSLSILWIGGMSVVMVIFANWLGCLTGISNIIMGVTLLAAGTSVPDALGSIISARQGMGDMAVANAIGSNVFDILICIGFPYMLYGWVNGRPYCVDTAGLLTHIIILFSTVIATIGVFTIMRWKLNKMVSAIMLVLYSGFLVYSIVAGIQQHAQILDCQKYGDGRLSLGSGHFLRNQGDKSIYEIYATQIFTDKGYSYNNIDEPGNKCRDVCGKRFADNDF